jgi:anti-anti-sigma regulatory factor
VDPAGLGLLLLTHHLCKSRGGDLVLVNPALCLRRLLSLTNSQLAQKVVGVPRLDLA